MLSKFLFTALNRFDRQVLLRIILHTHHSSTYILETKILTHPHFLKHKIPCTQLATYFDKGNIFGKSIIFKTQIVITGINAIIKT